ncbi:MAG: hypothetical protein ACI9G1_000622 [Pirellulaceae bacterium]|jgi:hypothetical protein
MTSRLCRCMVVGLLLQAMGTLAAADDDMPEPTAPVKISIAIPMHHGHRSLNDGDHLHVLVTNVSDKPIRVWTDRFSWGYDNLSFEMIDNDGNVTRVIKKPRNWTKNYPDWLELEAGGSYVLNVDWYSERGRAQWDNTPTADGKRGPTPVKLRAVYEVRPDDESRKLGVWAGKISSPVETYAIW